MGSVYYENLQNVELTGDYRTDIIAIAESQLGYHEGYFEDDLDGSSEGKSLNYTEYGRFMGSNGTAWCSEFASWCARMADVPTSILRSSRSANVKTLAAPYYSWEEKAFAGGDYMPRRGDLVLFAWSGKSLDDANLSHTAMVYDVTQTDTRVILTVIHGNCNNSVMISDHRANIADGKVSGGMVGYFVAPNY